MHPPNFSHQTTISSEYSCIVHKFALYCRRLIVLALSFVIVFVRHVSCNKIYGVCFHLSWWYPGAKKQQTRHSSGSLLKTDQRVQKCKCITIALNFVALYIHLLNMFLKFTFINCLLTIQQINEHREHYLELPYEANFHVFVKFEYIIKHLWMHSTFKKCVCLIITIYVATIPVIC